MNLLEKRRLELKIANILRKINGGNNPPLVEMVNYLEKYYGYEIIDPINVKIKT